MRTRVTVWITSLQISHRTPPEASTFWRSGPNCFWSAMCPGGTRIILRRWCRAWRTITCPMKIRMIFRFLTLARLVLTTLRMRFSMLVSGARIGSRISRASRWAYPARPIPRILEMTSLVGSSPSRFILPSARLRWMASVRIRVISPPCWLMRLFM